MSRLLIYEGGRYLFAASMNFTVGTAFIASGFPLDSGGGTTRWSGGASRQVIQLSGLGERASIRIEE